MPAAATVLRCQRRKPPARTIPTLDANAQCSTAAKTPRPLERVDALGCGCRGGCRRWRGGEAALLFLGRELCFVLLACDLSQHDLQPLAQLRHARLRCLG